MKIINGLVMVLCITQLTMAKSPFKLDVGSQQTIFLGETLDLNGKVLSGDKSKIDYYQWEENGKVIKNSSGDEIIYWDDANAENGYSPKVKGNHTLKFVVVDTAGKKHIKRLLVNVDTKDKVSISQDKDLKFDIRAEFPVKREQRSEGNYRLSRGHYLDVFVGDIIPLSGIIDASKKHLIDSYRWELNKKVLKNQLGDDIIYWDESNRENDYVPKVAGEEFLHFVVTDINGKETSKTLLLKIKDKNSVDKHGDTKDTATKIPLNRVVKGEKNNADDHDFFSFTLVKKQYVEVHIDYYNKSKRATLYTSGLTKIKSHRSIPGSALYRPINLLLEAGTYYVDASLYSGLYTLEIKTKDVVLADEYGDTKATATEVFDGTTINSYINKTEDVDYFYFMPKANGTISIKPTGVPKVQVGNEYTYGDPINVQKGKKVYLKVKLPSRNYDQHAYSFSLSFKKK
jgi:hypothetical protein